MEGPIASIIVLAYNHLDYTKLCIDSLYKYTSHIDFELITINNGSSDGTEEYFNSLPNKKKISFAENIGVDKAINYGYRAAEGKYTLNVSNDLILTPHWLDNLLACAGSDEKIGMVVPVSSFSSNYQQVNLGYTNLEDIPKKAEAYNVSNPNLWEERIRLITYCSLMPTHLQKQLGGFDEAYNPGGFDDDDISFRIRRAGYKLILARDTFIHHFGSVTFNAEYAKNDLLIRNRSIFAAKFGVDAWRVGAVDHNVVSLVDYSGQGTVEILGIGLSCAASLLQVKNGFRAMGNWDVKLWYLSEDRMTLSDLQTVCDHVVYSGTDKLPTLYEGKNFDIIVIESDTRTIKDLPHFLYNISRILKEGGQLIVTAPDGEMYSTIQRNLGYRYVTFKKSIANYYYAFAKEKIPERKVLLYPGYDFWLKGVLFRDRNNGNFLGVDVGENFITKLKTEFYNRGYAFDTIDDYEVNDAEYVIFLDGPKDPHNHFYANIPKALEKYKVYLEKCLQRKGEKPRLILILMEPPFVMPENYLPQMHECFDLVFTYMDDLVDGKRFFKYRYPVPTAIKNPYAKSFEEKKLCAMISSNKWSSVFGELYSERRKAISYFELAGDDFDLYGHFWAGSKSFRGVIKNKLETLSGYKFAICYENGTARGYITEKIFDGMFAGCIPVYLGAPNVTDDIPENTFIDRRKFKDYAELHEFMKAMDEKTYSQYLHNIENYLQSEQFQEFTHSSFTKNILDTLERNQP